MKESRAAIQEIGTWIRRNSEDYRTLEAQITAYSQNPTQEKAAAVLDHARGMLSTREVSPGQREAIRSILEPFLETVAQTKTA